VILLWGLSGDGPLHEVRQSLDRNNITYTFVDQRRILETDLEFAVGSASCSVRTGNVTLDLSEVTAVYLRNYDWRKLSTIADAGASSEEWAHAAATHEALNTWVELTDALVVNRPSAMASNSSKPYQAAIIRQCGFKVPETLITTDPDAILNFQAIHGTLIYKSISSVRSIVSKLTDEHLDRLEDVSWCPTQFQRYIPGRDYRLHIVGDDVFASEVITEADDYRYAGKQGTSLEVRACDLPPDIIERSRSTAAALQLAFAGVDLRRTPEDEWYCFEVNPSPGFTFYQSFTGQPIADAVANLLCQANVH